MKGAAHAFWFRWFVLGAVYPIWGRRVKAGNSGVGLEPDARRAVREAFGELGDGLPLVTVDLRPGREPERKKALVDAIAGILETELGSDPVDLYVLFRENPAENHYTGGSPLPDWVPADV